MSSAAGAGVAGAEGVAEVALALELVLQLRLEMLPALAVDLAQELCPSWGWSRLCLGSCCWSCF